MIFWLLFGIVFPPATAWLWVPINRWAAWHFRHIRYTRQHFVKDWFLIALFQIVISVTMAHNTPLAIGQIISAIIATCIWWYRRKKRRSAELLGAKSRALRDALVGNMHERRIQVDHP